MIFAQCPNLIDLSLKEFEGLVDESVPVLFNDGLHHLKYFRLTKCAPRGLTHVGMALIKAKCASLKAVRKRFSFMFPDTCYY